MSVAGPDDLTLRGMRSSVEIDVLGDSENEVTIDIAGAGTQSIDISLPGVIGPTGPTGPRGPAGGGEGAGAAGRFFDYIYVPTDEMTTFGVGELMTDGTLSFDTIDQPDASVIYVSSLTASGVDVAARIVALPIGGPLWVQDRDDSSMHATFLLTGSPTFDPVTKAWSLPVSYDAGNSAAPLEAGQDVLAGALDVGSSSGDGVGPTGPTGPTGPPGGGDGSPVAHAHHQTSAATTWTITHPLTFQPSVTVVDSLKQEIWPGRVEYLTPSVIRLTFSASVAGECYLS